MQDLVYLHGFLSSPQSAKAQQLHAWAVAYPQLRVHIPALPADPQSALRMAEDAVRACATPPAIMGSSLGGFYANILAARHHLRAVLINPAVHPQELLAQYIGENRHYHSGVAVEFRAEHVSFLRAVDIAPRTSEKTWVFLETGDETLDYQRAVQYYAGSAVDITEGGTHRYESFLEKLPAMYQFLFS